MTEQGNKRSSAPEQSESTSSMMSGWTGNQLMSLPQAREILREHVTLFVEELTTGQWYKLQNGTLDDVIERKISEVCTEMVPLLSWCIIQLLQQGTQNSGGVCLSEVPTSSPGSDGSNGWCLPEVPTSSPGSDGSDERCLPNVPTSSPSSDGSQRSVISQREIHHLLGDIIPYTFAEATGVQEDISCESTDKVTELLAGELTDVVNSELSRSCASSATSRRKSEGTDPQISSTCRSQAMVKYVAKILKILAAKIPCCKADLPERVKSPETCLPDKDQRSPGTEFTLLTETDDSMEVQLPETCKSSLTTVPSFDVDELDSAVAGDDFHDKTKEYIQSLLEAQANELIVTDSRDFEKEDDNQNQVDTSQVSEEVADAIVRSIMTDLDLKEDGAPRGMPRLEAQALCSVNVLRKLKAFSFQIAAKLSILQTVEKLRKKLNCFQGNTKESSFFQQNVDVMVEDMILPAIARVTEKGTDELCLYKSIAEDISSGSHQLVAKRLRDVISHYLHPGRANKKNLAFMLDIQLEVDSFMKLMWNWLNMQALLHERRSDLASLTLKTMKQNLPALAEVPVHEVQSTLVQVPDVDSPRFVSEELASIDEDDEADSESDESGEEAEDEIGQGEEEAGDEHLEEAGESTSERSQEWNEDLCGITVLILIKKFPNISPDRVEHIIKKLNEMLWREIAGCDIPVKPSHQYVNMMCKAVKKELCREWFTEKGLTRLLCEECEEAMNIVVETLKKHLLKPKKKTGIKAFFKSVFQKVAKPFTVCFKRRHED